MRYEIILFGTTLFFIMNAYHDGKYISSLQTFYKLKKYYQMAFYGFVGICVYLLIKHNPSRGREMLQQAHHFVKYMPIDNDAKHFIVPILDYTTDPGNSNSSTRITTSGKNGTKRSLSETKKKYVASRQNWKCEQCGNQLNHTFEIDHRVRLEYGGGNDVDNLVALCRNCHGVKTANENM